MKIATKTGDGGITSSVDGERISKNSVLLDAVGDIDELSAFIGSAKLKTEKYHELLTEIQKSFFGIMGELTCRDEQSVNKYIEKYSSFQEDDLKTVDNAVDFLQSLPELEQKHWVIYGDNESSARLDICSKVCRRAERRICRFRDNGIYVRGVIIKYFNRLSDLFYLMARYSEYENKNGVN